MAKHVFMTNTQDGLCVASVQEAAVPVQQFVEPGCPLARSWNGLAEQNCQDFFHVFDFIKGSELVVQLICKLSASV